VKQPMSDYHKMMYRAIRLSKYGITLNECEDQIRKGNRWCSRHKCFLPDEEFHSGRRGLCRCCERERQFEKMYNLPYTWYRKTLEAQGGTCAICKTYPEGKVLSLDHDHRCCGAGTSCGSCARGLLCTKCNILVGLIESNREAALVALYYCS
jgi:hypothetical protein